MRFKRRSASLVAAAMGALILAPIQPPVAFATLATAGNTTLAINSGSLIVFASGTQTFVNPANSYNVSVSNGTKTFYINNSGDFDTAGFALIITLPGKPTAIAECLGAVIAAVPDCLGVIGAPSIELIPAIGTYRPH